MLVVPQHEVVLIKARNPAHVQALIPHAQVKPHEGGSLICVPHKLEETKLLRNLGVPVPSPFAYTYRHSRTPFAVQAETAAFLTLHDRAYVLNGMGTGKTFASLMAYDWLRSHGKVGRMLVLCPLSTMEHTWEAEVFRWFPHLSAVSVHGTAKRRRQLLQDYQFDIYILNHDGLKVAGLVEEVLSRDDIDVILIDELATFRNAGTAKFKALARLTVGTTAQPRLDRRVWGLTGTPAPNAPTDVWAQCRLLTPWTVPKFFGRFKDATMRQVNQFLWVPKDDALEQAHAAMTPSVRYSLEQCVDLPPVITQQRYVPFTKAQEQAYKEMMDQLRVDLDEGSVTAVNAAVKFGKLLQIAAGAVKGDTGTAAEIDVGPRIDETIDIIQQSEGKVIVFANYLSVLDVLERQLGKQYSVARVDGSVSQHRRAQIFDAFQRAEEPRVLVAQPVSMSHGLTLTAANTIVWFTPSLSGEVATQANGRITRAGQTRSQLVVSLEGCPAERKQYKRLQTNESMQDVLLGLIEGATKNE